MKVIFCNNYRNIEEYFDESIAIVCDCAITLEIKFGSVLSSHFKNLSTSFLGFYAIVLVCKLHIYKYRLPTQLHHPHN